MHRPNCPDWRTVPLPERMRGLPTDHRGYPIPANILRDEAGVYHFIINDENKRQEQIKYQNCAICDNPLQGEFWFVGGPLSGLLEAGAYIDTAQHYECVTYALKVCPYLATRPYKRPDPDKVIERVAKTSEQQIFVDPTMTPGQPELFLLVGATQFGVILDEDGPYPNHVKYVKPTKVIRYEAWLDGVKQDKLLSALLKYCSEDTLTQLREAGRID